MKQNLISALSANEVTTLLKKSPTVYYNKCIQRLSSLQYGSLETIDDKMVFSSNRDRNIYFLYSIIRDHNYYWSS